MAQEESKFIKYLNNKVQIKEKAPVGDNIAIYIRPGDKIDLEALGINLENAKFKLIGGDIVLEMPGAGNYTFVSLALMGYGGNTPEFIGVAGKVTSLSAILSNIEEINALPINSIVTNEFVNLPNASEQDKKNKANEEKKNEATPQVIVIDNSVAMNDNISQSLAENTAQFMDRPIEDSVVNTNVSMKTDTNKAKATKTEDFTKDATSTKDATKDAKGDASVEGIEPTLSFDINIQHVEIRENTTIDTNGTTLTVYGGGGTSYANIYPKGYNLVDKTALVAQTKTETIDYSDKSGSYDHVVIHADDSALFDITKTSRTIQLTPSQPEGFQITKVTISSADFPEGFSALNGVASGNTWTIQKDNPLTEEIDGFTIANNGVINITFSVGNTQDSNFVFSLNATSEFSMDNVSEANRDTIIAPVKTLIEFEKDYAVQVKDIQIETKAKEYDFESFYLNGKQYTTGFVITTNINDTETKGSQELVNTIYGGIVNDTIYGGTKNDTIYGNTGDDTIAPGLGNDTVDGEAGNDTVSYSNLAVSNLGAGVVVDLTAQSAAGSGNDTLKSIENIIGSDFRDTLIGSIDINTIHGGAGNDTIDGKEANDTLFGEAGNDLFKSGFGDNYIDGGTGNNTVDYSQVTDSNGVIVKLLSPTAVSLGETWGESTSNSGNDRLVNIQNVIGTQYDDTFSGADNTNNSFDGGAGGSDLVDYSYYKSNAITVNLDEGWATGQGTDSLKNIDAIRGTDILAFGDTLIGSSTQGNTLYGMAGNDIIKGMGGNNSLYGGSGNDTIYSGKDDDFIDGGTGVNTVSYEDNTGGVTVYLGKETISQNTINAGNDTLKNIQNLIGTVFNDTLGASLTEVNTLNGLGG
ncbi:MAG: calcium-binding protein, partial [Aliarcobacter sp.]|nr:calcium-binding protein [Aliarcobacter sp.]